MKPILITAGLVLALGGCSQTPQPSLQPSRHSAPMAAQILPRSPGVGLRFHVDRPAYAALFQIIPGAGVSQVYPALGTGNMDGRVFSGNTSLNILRLANVEDYAPSPLLANGPRFYFLITSDRPLGIERFGTFGIGLRRELGLQFTAFNAFDTMERLAEMTVPVPGDEESWSTDFYVEWPNVLYNAPVAGLALVPLRCGSYRMYVPVDRVLEVDTRVCHPDRLESPTPPQSPADSSRATPKPRAPVPPASKPAPARPSDQRAATKAVRERIMASAQLETAGDDARAAARERPGSQRVTEARAREREGGSAEDRRSSRARAGNSPADVETTSARARPSASSSSSDASSSRPAASPSPAPAASPSPAPAPTPGARAPEPAPSPSARPDGSGR
jgi:hypothetical protein